MLQPMSNYGVTAIELSDDITTVSQSICKESGSCLDSMQLEMQVTKLALQ
jgi:hypothetical protein